jgi:trimeric autotransporter adhesin
MKPIHLSFGAALAIWAAILLPAAGHAQPVVHGLTTGNTLVRFSATGGAVVPGPALSGLGAGEAAVGIDFRPLTSELYLLTRDAANLGRLYTVDPGTGQATAVPLSGAALTLSGSVDIDFNPAALSGANALRIVTGGGQNYRLVFGAGGATVNVDGALNLPGGGTPNVIATAY